MSGLGGPPRGPVDGRNEPAICQIPLCRPSLLRRCDQPSGVAVLPFPLGLQMAKKMLAVRGIIVSHETVRQWAPKFGQAFANRIRRRLPCGGKKWHLDEAVIKIVGVKHWLWRAVDQTGI